MGFFSRFFPEKRVDLPRIDHLESKVRLLEDRLTDVERRMKGIELDWEQTYDKVTHLMARVTKRQKALQAEQQASSTLLDAPGDENSPAPGPPPSGYSLGMHGRLQEMRRRNGLLPR